ncbi:phosphotransferase family protein [Bacillus sp. CGMCC 1.16607]|uniref:phosphotransferase family protein n=1 Tax=Bacillus sp. CGMCC 1.16607 TaxID=3351842 RepID=UPI0036281D1A
MKKYSVELQIIRGKVTFLTLIENRFYEYNWTLIHKEELEGIHAGNIARMTIKDENNKVKKIIYKEFANSRKNEMDVYAKLLPTIKSMVPIIQVVSSAPEAVIMDDLGESIKENFKDLSKSKKYSLLEMILHKLLFLHNEVNKCLPHVDLPTHKVTSEWYKWACSQLNELKLQNLEWYNNSWIDIVNQSFKMINAKNYKIKGPLVLTHGDPHLENIFLKDSSILFIDWEWAAIASPLRDITILLQDIYDVETIEFVKNTYFQLALDAGLFTEDIIFKEDFNYLYFDHTLMMLAWEIEKYFKGLVSESRIVEVINFKVNQMQNVVNDKRVLSGVIVPNQ